MQLEEGGLLTMQVPATERRSIQVGPFVVDFLSHELRNHHRKIPLQEKPFQVLTILLDRPGELVTREELREKLWPADTFVDFEHSINTAVRKLRDALEDHAEEPHFIETVPRRGYRLIASVAETPTEEDGAYPLTSAAGPTVVIRETSPACWRYGPYLFLAGTAVVVVGIILFGLNVGGIRERLLYGKISAQDTIVVADFSNSTGDPLFDDTLKQALSIALKQSPFLNVLPENKVEATLRRMARPAGTVLAGEVIRQLCQRVGSKAYIAGSIAKLDGEYVLGLKAVNCLSGNLLAKELTTVASREQVLDALGKEAATIRSQLGESLATVRRFDVPLAQATTSSLEALKAFSLAGKADTEKGTAAALTYDLRAIQLDPNFALGYLAVGNDYNNLGEPGRASDYYTKAFQLQGHASEREKLEIAADYYSNVTGELDKVVQNYQEEIENYPREFVPHDNLGQAYSQQGQYEKAAEITRQALLLAPDLSDAYENLANYEVALQRFDEARQIIHEAHARRLDNDYFFHNTLYALAFLGEDATAMAEQQRWFAGHPEYEIYGLSLASDTETYAGHFGKARELTKRAVDAAIRADNKETGAIHLANTAVQQAAFGNTRDARQSAAKALKLASTSKGVESEAALAFAMAGDMARAESLARDLGKHFPLDTQMQSLWLPAIQAQLALDRKHTTAALDALQAASPIELAAIPFGNSLSCLYPVYVRGEAYLAAGQGSAAAAEFQKILDHGGIVWNCWTGALARLGVARANALAATASKGAEADAARARALAAYRDFLTLWKDADPDIPILKQAKAEYAKLQ